MAIRLAISGALGRMGSMVRNLAASDPRFEVVQLLEAGNHPAIGNSFDLGAPGKTLPLEDRLTPDAQVLVDFTTPAGFKERLLECVRAKVAIVSGTTGLSQEHEDLLVDASSVIPVFYAPNMSLGIEALGRAVSAAASLLPDEFDVELTEVHHRGKVDAPSGTAWKIIRLLAAERKGDEREISFGREGRAGPRNAGEIGVHSLRGGDVIGEHTVLFLGPGERLEITHRCTDRAVFARGALHAASRLASEKPGLIHFSDMRRKPNFSLT